MIRPLILSTALTISLAGCGGAQETESESETSITSPENANVPDPSVTTNSESEMAFVRKRFERVKEMETRGSLRCDTLPYRCAQDPSEGVLIFCFVGDDLVRASHEFTVGDHGGSETFYYDDADLYLSHLTQSVWSFASPTDVNTEGMEEPHTVEDVSEVRSFYYNGNLIDRQYKDYRIESWKPTPNQATLPNQRTGKGVNPRIAGEQLFEVAHTRTYTCN